MNVSSKQFEKVIDLVYDAAAENDLWPSVLTAIADLTGSQGSILFGQSFAARKVYFDYNGRLDPDCNRAYQERHMQNCWSEHMQDQPVGRVVMSDEAIPLSELRRTAFYDEVLRPQGTAHNAMIALAAQRDYRASFNLCRSALQGPFSPQEFRLIEWLTPHLRRSIALGFRIDAYFAMQRAAFSILDQFTDGLIVLNRSAHVVFVNAAARRFEANGALRLRPSLSTASLIASRRLNDLIKASLNGAAGGTMRFPYNDEGQSLTLLVSSIRSKDVGRLSDAGLKDPAVLMLVIDPANRRSIPLRQMIDTYGLTHAEARVALAVSSGNTIGGTARLLKLSPNTIKTHLRRVFAKTATGRQAELAGLVTAVGRLRVTEKEIN